MTATLPARVDMKTFYPFVMDRISLIANAPDDNHRISHKIYSLREWVEREEYNGSVL
jgi:hypothetical protein